MHDYNFYKELGSDVHEAILDVLYGTKEYLAYTLALAWLICIALYRVLVYLIWQPVRLYDYIEYKNALEKASAKEEATRFDNLRNTGRI